MTFEQFATIWSDFKDGYLTIVTTSGSWEVSREKEQLSIIPTKELFIYQETQTSPKFIFSVSAIDHVRYEA